MSNGVLDWPRYGDPHLGKGTGGTWAKALASGLSEEGAIADAHIIYPYVEHDKKN